MKVLRRIDYYWLRFHDVLHKIVTPVLWPTYDSMIDFER